MQQKINLKINKRTEMIPQFSIWVFGFIFAVEGSKRPCPINRLKQNDPSKEFGQILDGKNYNTFCKCWNLKDNGSFSLDKLFSLHMSAKSFDDAQTACSSTLNSLAIVKTEEERILLDCMLNMTKQQTFFWIGLRKNEMHAWQWADGEELMPSDPYVIELNNNNHNCTRSSGRDRATEDCSQKMPYACQIEQGSRNEVKSLISEYASMLYLRNMTVEKKLGHAKLLGLVANDSFQLNAVNYELDGDLTQQRKTSDGYQEIEKTTTIRNVLDIFVLENTTVQLNYTIEITDQSANDLFSVSAGERIQIKSATVRCYYIDATTGEYLSDGLKTIISEDGYICNSNHATIFAALLSVVAVVIPYNAKILTYVTESISVASLLLTIGVLIPLRKKLRNDRTTVQINLAFALLLLHIASIIHDTALSWDRLCEVIAVTIHFSMLSSAHWMMIEGITLLLKTSGNALRYPITRMEFVLRIAFGWLLPAIIVAGTAIPGFIFDFYMPRKPALLANVTQVPVYTKCWLKGEATEIGVLLTATVPIALTILINVFILFKVASFVYRMSSQTVNFQPTAEVIHGVPIIDTTHMKAGLRAIVMLLPVLSVPWSLFILAGTSEVFIYLSILVNGLQGLFVFLIYCVFSNEVQDTMKSMWNRSEIARRIKEGRKKT